MKNIRQSHKEHQETNNNAAKSMRRNLIIDGVALIVYFVVSTPQLTGIALHEWLGLVILVLIITHIVMHYDWIIDVISSKEKRPTLARQGNLLLDGVTFVTVVVVIVSGLGVSATILPALGYFVEGYFFWGPLHAISAKLLLALLILHLAVHWKWILSAIKNEKEARDE